MKCRPCSKSNMISFPSFFAARSLQILTDFLFQKRRLKWNGGRGSDFQPVERSGRDAVKKVREDPPVRDRDSERKKGGTGIVRDELRLKTRGRRRWKWSCCLSDFFPVFLSCPWSGVEGADRVEEPVRSTWHSPWVQQYLGEWWSRVIDLLIGAAAAVVAAVSWLDALFIAISACKLLVRRLLKDP